MEQLFFLKLFRLVKWNTYDYITEKLLGSLNSSLHMMKIEEILGNLFEKGHLKNKISSSLRFHNNNKFWIGA